MTSDSVFSRKKDSVVKGLIMIHGIILLCTLQVKLKSNRFVVSKNFFVK